MARRIALTVSLDVLSIEEWSDNERILIEKAKSVLENAHAPYSDFFVGSALLMENGQIFTANNQENISFPVGICAERAVLSYALGNSPNSRPIKLAIVAKKRVGEELTTVTPCGLCRQTISEYEMKFGAPIEIIMLNAQGQILKASGIEQLLPFRFENPELKKIN